MCTGPDQRILSARLRADGPQPATRRTRAVSADAHAAAHHCAVRHARAHGGRRRRLGGRLVGGQSRCHHPKTAMLAEGEGGSGIGLSVVADAVRRLNGTVRLEPRRPNGAGEREDLNFDHAAPASIAPTHREHGTNGTKISPPASATRTAAATSCICLEASRPASSTLAALATAPPAALASARARTSTDAVALHSLAPSVKAWLSQSCA